MPEVMRIVAPDLVSYFKRSDSVRVWLWRISPSDTNWPFINAAIRDRNSAHEIASSGSGSPKSGVNRVFPACPGREPAIAEFFSLIVIHVYCYASAVKVCFTLLTSLLKPCRVDMLRVEVLLDRAYPPIPNR